MEVRLNNTQEISLGSRVTGGTYTLTYAGITSDPLPFDATQQEVTAAVYLLESEARLARKTANRQRARNNMIAAAAAAGLLVALMRKWHRGRT